MLMKRIQSRLEDWWNETLSTEGHEFEKPFAIVIICSKATWRLIMHIIKIGWFHGLFSVGKEQMMSKHPGMTSSKNVEIITL